MTQILSNAFDLMFIDFFCLLRWNNNKTVVLVIHELSSIEQRNWINFRNVSSTIFWSCYSVPSGVLLKVSSLYLWQHIIKFQIEFFISFLKFSFLNLFDSNIIIYLPTQLRLYKGTGFKNRNLDVYAQVSVQGSKKK